MKNEWGLTEAEANKVVEDWMNVDFAVRYIRLGRGHWEDIVPLIVQTQLQKIAGMLEIRLHSICDEFGYPANITRKLSLLSAELNAVELD